MIELDRSAVALPILVICALVAAANGMSCYIYLRYHLLGESTEAQFMKFSDMPESRPTAEDREDYDLDPDDRDPRRKWVRYTWTDRNGDQQMGYDSVDIDWQPPADGRLSIHYLPGKTMIGGNTQSALYRDTGPMAAVWFGLGLLGALISTVVAFSAPVRKRRRHR